MKFARSLFRPALLLTGAFATGVGLVAQESPYDLEKEGWYVRTGAYLQMGMSVSVSRTAPLPVITPGIYDNGFVQKDVGGGADNLTWNWGYLEESQLIDGKLQLSRVEGLSLVDGLDNFGSENLFGPEILVGFEFYQFQIKQHDGRFGFELGFRYGSYSGSDQGSVESDVLLQQDRYSLGGVVAPLPPYIGFPDVAGPLISLTPEPQPPRASRAVASLNSTLDADFYTGRFGAWMGVKLTEKWTAGMSAGFTTIYAYGRAEFTETHTFENPAFTPVHQTVTESKGDWLPGAYLQLRSSYWIRPWVSVYLSAEWAHNGSLRIDGLGYQARFDFGSTFGASAGAQFSF